MKYLPLICVLMLSGCSTYSLEELRHTEPKGTAFQKALAREYMAYSSQEEQNYDWPDSWHFADKGLMAAYGNDVGPEDLSMRALSNEFLVPLTQARDDLLTVLTPDMVKAEPLLAARATMQFDCWVERAENAWETAKIAACREGFEESLSALQAKARPASRGGIGGPEQEVTSYLVLFDWNRSTLNMSGKRIVSDVVQSLASEDAYEIVLNGHTDTTGLEKFNLSLSKKRAESVAYELESQGINAERIKIFAFGESDLRVPTPDNTDEPRNRRVEIFIQ
jgi:OOP family OmpA-OmpF porin